MITDQFVCFLLNRQKIRLFDKVFFKYFAVFSSNV